MNDQKSTSSQNAAEPPAGPANPAPEATTSAPTQWTDTETATFGCRDAEILEDAAEELRQIRAALPEEDAPILRCRLKRVTESLSDLHNALSAARESTMPFMEHDPANGVQRLYIPLGFVRPCDHPWYQDLVLKADGQEARLEWIDQSADAIGLRGHLRYDLLILGAEVEGEWTEGHLLFTITTDPSNYKEITVSAAPPEEEED